MSQISNPLNSTRCHAWSIFVLVFIFSLCYFALYPGSILAINRVNRSGYNCIQISTYGQSREGIGALFRRNQLAFFLAETYNARVSFPEVQSTHGYKVADLFDTCPKPTNSCVLSEERIALPRCRRGDCACHRQKLEPYTTDLVKNCKSILVNNAITRTTEYSGCFRNVALRYLASDKQEAVEFDAIHLRSGDLAGRQSGKAFSDMETYLLLRSMCNLSDRDIIVVTEGIPKLPVVKNCMGRLVLAADTSLPDAFRIFQHAKHVAAGSSAFAILLMEVAKPARMIVLQRAVYFYEWLDVERWTVIGNFGAVFHFDTKEMMVEACIHGKDLKFRSFVVIDRFEKMKSGLEFEAPRRRWTNDSSWAEK